VHPAGKVFSSVWSMIPESVFPLTMGEIPKHFPSVGTKAVVRGVGPALQPSPEKMLRGTASRRLEREGAALTLAVAAKRRAVRNWKCILELK
jgi:hypothetical protein